MTIWNTVNNWFIIIISFLLCMNLICGAAAFIQKRQYASAGTLAAVVKASLIFSLFIPVMMTELTVRQNCFYRKVPVDMPDFSYMEGFSGLLRITNYDKIFYRPLLFILAVWSAGFIISLGRFLFKEFLGQRKMASYTGACSQKEMEILMSMQSKLGIKKNISLQKSALVYTPFLTGILHPQIILPDASLPEEELNLLLQHELMHYKHHDIFFKLVFKLAEAVLWFYPLVKTYQKNYCELCELACDRAVVAALPAKERAEYARLLLKFAGKNNDIGSTVAFSETEYKTMERRIYNIMKKTGGKRAGFAFLTAALIFTSVPVTSYASSLGLLHATDWFLNEYMERNSVEVEQDEFITETGIVDEDIKNTRCIGTLAMRADNSVDYKFGAVETVHYTSFELNAGDEVHISLTAENSSDKFEAGLIDGNKKKTYASSNRGSINKTLTVKTTGEYTVYFKGKNTNGADIHVVGRIDIE